jgi:hypothetical protein
MEISGTTNVVTAVMAQRRCHAFHIFVTGCDGDFSVSVMTRIGFPPDESHAIE